VERVTAEEHACAKAALERAVQQAPEDSDCSAMLSIMLTDEHIHGFSARTELLEEALQFARRAVDANPLNHRAYQALAWVLCYRKEFDACRHAAERTVALNPMDASAMAYVGQTIAYGGGWERGCELLNRAMQLNPHHPGWYRYAPFLNAYRQGDYHGALDIALKMNMPGVSLMYVALAAVYGQLGEPEAAREAVRELLALRPDFKQAARTELEKLWDPELVGCLIDGLRKVGLEISDQAGLAEPLAARQPSGEQRADEGFWVAVLPFKSTGDNAGVAALAEGLTEDIITGLSRFSYLRVIARGSTLRYANQTTDLREVGTELGARYVMEGSLRQAGSVLRIAVQMVDASTGAHLWAENYSRTFSPEAVFELQDDLVPRIVSTVADWYGVLPHSMSEAVRLKPPEHLSPYEAVLRSFGYFERIAPEEHAAVRAGLERAVEQAPSNADGWAMLSMIYGEEYRFEFNVQPDPLGRSLQAARRAVDAAHGNHFAWLALAQALFFRKEFDAFRDAADRAITLNPMDGSALEYLGHLIAFAGDWERGCDVAERARQLNPNHPGWYWAVYFLDAYRKGDYHSARTYLLKGLMRGGGAQLFQQALLAALYGQLGEREAAGKTLQTVLALKPDFPLTGRAEFGKWYRPELVDQLMDGLRKAGLEIVDEERTAESSVALQSSGEKRADEGFWVAVLPFKSTGTNSDIKSLAEGLSEEIVTGLSRFSYLRVIALSSTSRHTSDSSDVRSIGKELGARYVMEGSVRHAGSVLRIAVQLVDASTGAHLWAETYDRTFSPEAVFELQDDLVPRIVSTVADMNGVLPRSMSESVRNRAPDQLSAYEAVLRSFSYFERVTAEELTDALSCLELAVQKAPAYADAWSLIAALCTQDYGQGFNVHPDSLARGAVAARKAVEAAPSNHLAWFGLAQVLFFQKEFQSFRNAVERTAALNPMDGNSIAFLGEMLTYAGDWERGLELAERAKQLNPHHPGWYWYANFYQAYRQGDYRGALSFAHKVNLPGHWGEHVMFAAACGQLGEREAADKAVRELLKLRPDFVAKVRSDIEKWWDSEYVERLIDGFRKAGLEIADEKVVSAASPATETRTMAQASFSIAVLPFGNLSPDPDNEFFADGLTEEVIADLSVIRALRVISRTSVMHFKGTSKDLRTIARELDVRYVLEGSVRRAGTSLRVTAQLIDAENDSNLWAEKYSGSIEDVFAIQEEISRKIVNALQLRLTDAEARGITERPIDNAAAYDCYMRARHEVYRFTPEGLDRAQKLVDAGLSLIGENSLLLATRGMVSWYYLNFSIRPEERYLNEAAAYAAMSLEQDPQNYAGIFLRGLVASKRGDIESAIRDLQTAHEQKPGDAMVLNELIRHLSSAGQEQSESARRVFEESLSLDPLHALNWAQGAWRHFSAGRLAEAVEAARRIFHLTDRGNPARVYAGYYLALANVREEAIAVFEEEGAALSDTVYGSVSLFLSRALQHDAQGAVRHVTPQLEQAASWTEYLALFLADGYALIGDHDAALRWLRTAVAQGFINYPYLATRDPFLANVRSDPRFAELMRGVKARWEALSQNLMPIQAQHRVFIHSVIPSPAFEASAEADTPLPEIESGNNKSVERQEKEEALLSPSHRSSVSPTLRHTVGRERERNELRAAFNAAKDGRGLLLCIAGEPGIGKTTLVEDFLADLTTESQCTIARGRCSERLAGTGAYLPLLEALESLLQRDQSLAQTMKQLAPTWYAQVAPLSGDSEESARLLAEVKAASQERIKRELASFLQAVARTQPLVIFFDDLHWADISTIDLLSFLAGKFDSMNLLMVVTYRPSDMLLAKHPFLQIKPDLQARGVCRELVLEFLTEPEIAEYLALEFPDHCFPPEFQKLIHAKTEGSPLFMADLVRYLRDRNVIAIEDSRQDASAPRWA
ncbi:MAG TPA: AAA family ATPase, partial [Pyrinomonadaceae bacterium]|nr:AAA family ATPase [Pyrinomonadaceae bacterium]